MSCAIPLDFHPRLPHLLISPGTCNWTKESPPSFADLCCGGTGGFTLACMFAQLTPKVAVDFDPHCLDSFENTFLPCFPSDSILDSHLASTQWLHKLVGVSVICAGIPCQPYSNLGANRRERDGRDLLEKIMDIVHFIRPAALIRSLIHR